MSTPLLQFIHEHQPLYDAFSMFNALPADHTLFVLDEQSELVGALPRAIFEGALWQEIF